MVPEDSSLITALFLINLARWANFKVESVSPRQIYAGLILAQMRVLELPPSESLSKKVNLLSL